MSFYHISKLARTIPAQACLCPKDHVDVEKFPLRLLNILPNIGSIMRGLEWPFMSRYRRGWNHFSTRRNHILQTGSQYMAWTNPRVTYASRPSLNTKSYPTVLCWIMRSPSLCECLWQRTLRHYISLRPRGSTMLWGHCWNVEQSRMSWTIRIRLCYISHSHWSTKMSTSPYC